MNELALTSTVLRSTNDNSYETLYNYGSDNKLTNNNIENSTENHNKFRYRDEDTIYNINNTNNSLKRYQQNQQQKQQQQQSSLNKSLPSSPSSPSTPHHHPIHYSQSQNHNHHPSSIQQQRSFNLNKTQINDNLIKKELSTSLIRNKSLGQSDNTTSIINNNNSQSRLLSKRKRANTDLAPLSHLDMKQNNSSTNITLNKPSSTASINTTNNNSIKMKQVNSNSSSNHLNQTTTTTTTTTASRHNSQKSNNGSNNQPDSNSTTNSSSNNNNNNNNLNDKIKKQIEIKSRIIFLKLGQIDTRNERYDAEAFIECFWEDDDIYKLLADPNMAKNSKNNKIFFIFLPKNQTII
jgi:hypothetical protein